MRRILFLFLAAVAFLSGPVCAEPPKYRAVIQVSENDTKKWNALFGNLRNVRADLGADKVSFAIVAIGPGIDLLKADSLVANRVEEAMADGVRFVACENTMKAQHVPRDDMMERIDYVPAGFAEIIRLQQEGWAYLRP
jgi:intracellular sulfur oxidation DsrE/DsrF family protein